MSPQALKGSGSGSSHLTFLERRHFDEAEGQSLLEEAHLEICWEEAENRPFPTKTTIL